MKNLLITLFMCLGSYGHAGAISGGGGKGVVCRDGSGAITSARTLDLYEGEVVYGLNIMANVKLTVPTLVNNALAKIPINARTFINFYVNNVEKNMRIVKGVKLEPIDDALVVAVPQGCEAEQLANYFNDSNIIINGDIWDSLSNVERAALIMHEGVYAAERAMRATNSLRARHVVASLFDDSTKWVDPKDGAPKDALNCFTDDTYFLAFKNADGSWTLQFQFIGGHQTMSKNIADSPVTQTAFDFQEAKTFPIVPGEERIGTKNSLFSLTHSLFESNDGITLTKRWEAPVDVNGNALKGYQTPRYYFTWTSQNYPGVKSPEQPLNCSLTFP